MLRKISFVFSLAIFIAGCHTIQWTGEVRLISGETIQCPAGINFLDNGHVSCLRDTNPMSESHSPINLDKANVSEIILRNAKVQLK